MSTRCVRAAPHRLLQPADFTWEKRPPVDAAAAELSDVCAVHYAPTQVNATFTPVQEVTVCLVCRHHHRHGLPFPPDVDVTLPACWLHSGSAPRHPHLLEYHQGTWHDKHLIAYSTHLPWRRKSREEEHLFAQHSGARLSSHRVACLYVWELQTSTCQPFSNQRSVASVSPSPTFTFFCQSLLLQPVATCSVISFLSSIFCRRCTFTTRTPPTSSLPATRPAGAPGSITVSARLVFSHPSVEVPSSWLRSMFVEMKWVQWVVWGNVANYDTAWLFVLSLVSLWLEWYRMWWSDGNVIAPAVKRNKVVYTLA